MKFYSTKQQSPKVNLKEAVMVGLPPDNGLYMPENIGQLPASFFKEMGKMPFKEMAFQVAECLLQDTIPTDKLKEIVYGAVNFEAPLVPLNEQMSVLELFHGPSLAFKDFGARFMARLMGYFVENETKELVILVATSGDTGGAVAAGFYKTPGIKVVILYPSQKVSELQEKQLTTLGENIQAIEVKGTFDDCQRLVKSAFLDQELREELNISSANSINLARLVPQTFYYFRAYAHLNPKEGEKVAVCVPSGNFGNLTAGLIAQKMGLPIQQFIASNNSNNVVEEYLEKGIFNARSSVRTHSNAMDVGNPSNLQRIQDLYQNDLSLLRSHIKAYSYSNEETIEGMKTLQERFNYVACPHTAVAYLGLNDYLKTHPDYKGIFLATAHPAKFMDVVQLALDKDIPLPSALANLSDKTKVATLMNTDYTNLRAYLMAMQPVL